MEFEPDIRNQPSHEAQDVIFLIDDLLDKERHALLNGDLEKATRLVHDKEALFARFAQQPGKILAEIERLRAKAARNQQLLSSALEGVRMVNDRIQVLRRTRETLETYDRSCRKTTIAHVGAHTFEKRA